MKAVTVRVEQDKNAPVEQSVLAQAIVDISHAMRVLTSSGMNRKAIVILAAHSSGQSQAKVLAVMNALEGLEREYVRR